MRRGVFLVTTPAVYATGSSCVLFPVTATVLPLPIASRPRRERFECVCSSMSFRPGAPPSSTLPATVSSTAAAAAALVPSDEESPVDWDHQDPYAPRQPGLPLYTVNKDHHAMSGAQEGTGTRSTGGGGGVEVVDSSTARRRPQGQSPAAFVDSATDPLLLDRRDHHHAADDDDAEKKMKEPGKDGKEVWPVSGIGMEGRIPETRRDFLAKGGGTATRPRREVTWVSPRTTTMLAAGLRPSRRFAFQASRWTDTVHAERRRPRTPVRLAATSPSHHIHHPRALHSPVPHRSQSDRRLGRGQSPSCEASQETRVACADSTRSQAHFGKFGAYYLNRTFYFDVRLYRRQPVSVLHRRPKWR